MSKLERVWKWGPLTHGNTAWELSVGPYVLQWKYKGEWEPQGRAIAIGKFQVWENWDSWRYKKERRTAKRIARLERHSGFIKRLIAWPLGWYACSCCETWKRRTKYDKFNNRGGLTCGSCTFG